MSATIPMQWTGEHFVPHHRFRAECDRSFVVGEIYPLALQEHRSSNTHRHFFAAVNDAWLNLPESMAGRFETSEHLRKFALIKAGYRDERSIACSSKAEARRLAAFIKPMDDFAVVTVTESVVTVYTAKSQSMQAMGKQVFQESKTKVLDVIAGMISVEAQALSDQVGRAA